MSEVAHVREVKSYSNEEIKDLIKSFKAEFEKLAAKEADIDYWKARDLCRLLGYQERDWKNFHEVIKRVLGEALVFDRLNSTDIVETVYTYETGAYKTPRGTVDYNVSVNGCAVIAGRANDNKIEVLVARYVIQEMRDAKLKGFANADGDKFNPNFAANAQVIDGNEWWSARWLCGALGYIEEDWRPFSAVIDKVKTKHKRTIKIIHANSLQATDNHVPGLAPVHDGKAHVINTTVSYPIGNKGGMSFKPEYLLDEEMCYLVAMNANINFKGVIAAQAFFAKRLKQARIDDLKFDSNQCEWLNGK